MADKIFDFENIDNIIDDDNLVIRSSGLTVDRNQLGQINLLYDTTITDEADTTTALSTNGTDWDLGTSLKASGLTKQQFNIDLGAGSEIYLSQLEIYVNKQESDTINDVRVFTSTDDTNYLELILDEIDNDSAAVVVNSHRPQGQYTRYIRIIMTGTANNPDEIWISELTGYRSEYITPFVYAKHTDVLKLSTNKLTTFTEDPTTAPSGASRTYHLYKDTDAYYYDGSDWVVVTDVNVYDEQSNTAVEVNSNIGSFLTGISTEVSVSVGVVLNTSKTSAPAISTVTIGY